MAKLNLNGDGNEENHSAANLQPTGGGKKRENESKNSLPEGTTCQNRWKNRSHWSREDLKDGIELELDEND